MESVCEIVGAQRGMGQGRERSSSGGQKIGLSRRGKFWIFVWVTHEVSVFGGCRIGFLGIFILADRSTGGGGCVRVIKRGFYHLVCRAFRFGEIYAFPPCLFGDQE